MGMEPDLEQVFKDWERYFATLLRAKGWRKDDDRAVANHDRWFLQWVDKSPDLPTTAQRRTVRAEFDRRKAISEVPDQDVAQAVAQAAEEREEFLRAYLDPAERRRFDTWLVQHPDPDLERVHGHVGVFGFWKQEDKEYRDRQQRDAVEREAELRKQEAALREQETVARREVEAHVADATWRRGASAAASAEEADDEPSESEDDDDVAEQLDRTTASRKRRIIRFVTKKPGCGIKAVGGGPKGRREANVQATWELVAEGKLVNRGTEQRPKFYAAGTEGTAEA